MHYIFVLSRCVFHYYRDLTSNKVSLCNDGIRDAYKCMGDHHVTQGDLGRALTSYMGMQDYCATPVQLIEMYLKVMTPPTALKNGFGRLCLSSIHVLGCMCE